MPRPRFGRTALPDVAFHDTILREWPPMIRVTVHNSKQQRQLRTPTGRWNSAGSCKGTWPAWWWTILSSRAISCE